MRRAQNYERRRRRAPCILQIETNKSTEWVTFEERSFSYYDIFQLQLQLRYAPPSRARFAQLGCRLASTAARENNHRAPNLRASYVNNKALGILHVLYLEFILFVCFPYACITAALANSSLLHPARLHLLRR